MQQFISESIMPGRARFDAAAMARGEPGLPVEFTWREHTYQVLETLEYQKVSAPEGGRATGERYLRRHRFKLRMSGGETWTVYFVRRAAKPGSRVPRWFLYSIE